MPKAKKTVAKKKVAAPKKLAPVKTSVKSKDTRGTPMEKKDRHGLTKTQERSYSSFWIGLGVVVVLVVAGLMFARLYSPGEVAEIGDPVSVSYVGTRDDGQVFDEGELNFTIGNNQLLEDFENAVIGLKVDQTTTVQIPPERAYGKHDPNQVMRVSRFKEYDRLENVSVARLEKFTQEEVVAGNMIRIRGVYWPVLIASMKDGRAYLRHEPELNKTYRMLEVPWDPTVVELTIDKIITRADNLDVGQPIVGPHGGVGRLLSWDDNNLLVDFNSPLAGENLNFEITLLEILDEQQV